MASSRVPFRAGRLRHAPSNIPASIDATGSKDVSAELNAFIRNAPNGSTIVFKAGGTYRLGEVVRVLGKKRITLEGNGATLKLTGPIDFFGAGIFVEQLSEDITIRDLTIVGQHAAAGTKDALGRGENQNAIAVYGSTNTLIERVDIRRVGGDCLYVSAHERRIWSDGVTFRDSTCRLTGRMGVTVIAGSRVRVVNNTFDEIGYAVVGIEPDAGNEGARDVVVRDNTVGSYSLTDQYEGFLFYACNAPWSDGAVVRDVTVSGNTVAGNLAGKGGMRGTPHPRLRECHTHQLHHHEQHRGQGRRGPRPAHPGRQRRDRHRQQAAALLGLAGHVLGIDQRDLQRERHVTHAWNADLRCRREARLACPREG